MTKADLIANVAKKAGTSKALAGRVVDSALSELQNLLTKGDSIALTGFGSFSVSKRAKRQGRNPQTGAAITIPASKSVRFRPGKGLRESVRKS